jgi:hypothetical protein
MKTSKHSILNMEGFETTEQAKERRDKRAELLWKSDNEEDKILGDIISNCVKRRPCGSAACPICFRVKRISSSEETSRINDMYPRAWTMTAVYYSEAMTGEQLASCDPLKISNRLRTQLRRSGFKHPVVGSIEFDFHEESGLWLPHYHLITFDDKEARERLRKVLKSVANHGPDNKINRPFRVDKLKDPAEQISYLLKSYSKRISASYLTGKRKTFQLPLRPQQERLILVFKHRIGYSKLIFRYKCKLIGKQLVPTVSTKKCDEG